MYNSLRGSYSSLSRDSSPQSSPHRGSPRTFRSSFNSEISKSYIESNRNGFGNNKFNSNNHRDEKPLKLPPWDQASAEFYFARSRDLLTKIMPQIPISKENRSEPQQQNGSNHYDGTIKGNGSSHYDAQQKGNSLSRYDCQQKGNGLNHYDGQQKGNGSNHYDAQQKGNSLSRYEGQQQGNGSNHYDGQQKGNGSNLYDAQQKGNGLKHFYENWSGHESSDNRLNNFSRLKLQNENIRNQKTNGNPSVIHKKEVPSNDNLQKHQINNVVLRKCGSRNHLRRRSYNDRYPSSTSSDSSDSFNLSESEKQMNHRLKMRKQRRGGSFSHQISQLKSPQYLLNSPPPQNSFLNSVTSPKNSPVSRNKFYFANFKPLNKNDGNQQHRSLNNLTKPNYLSLSGYEMKWPDRARDSSSLTFTSSNSSSLNWEEYPEFDRDFLSFSNNCPPSPAPQV